MDGLNGPWPSARGFCYCNPPTPPFAGREQEKGRAPSPVPLGGRAGAPYAHAKLLRHSAPTEGSAASNSSTSAQPPSSSFSPILPGRWRSTRLKHLLILTRSLSVVFFIRESASIPKPDTESIRMDGTPIEIGPAIQRALSHGAPCFVELVTPGEHKMIAPVAEWQCVTREAAKQN